MLTFDHIAISGQTLDAAQAHVEEALGVPMQPGGTHAVFHTHNALLGLDAGLYLEAIAINPDAPQPDRPRWFDLDRFTGPPRLSNWICRSSDLAKDISTLPFSSGAPVALQRGDLRWEMAVPDTGQLAYDNVAPAVMAWQTDAHPAARLTPRGVRLRSLLVSHPDADELKVALAPLLHDPRVHFDTGAAGLEALFDTPHGPRRLE